MKRKKLAERKFGKTKSQTVYSPSLLKGCSQQGRRHSLERKRWRKGRKRKILVKKGYIDEDDGPQPEDFPSQFN